VELCGGPEQMPYGMLEFAIKDLNGYMLSFGQPDKGSPSSTARSIASLCPNVKSSDARCRTRTSGQR
jgi:hypothetical protein